MLFFYVFLRDNHASFLFFIFAFYLVTNTLRELRLCFVCFFFIIFAFYLITNIMQNQIIILQRFSKLFNFDRRD